MNIKGLLTARVVILYSSFCLRVSAQGTTFTYQRRRSPAGMWYYRLKNP